MEDVNNLKVAELKISYKKPLHVENRPNIFSPSDIANIMRKVYDMKTNIEYKELFYAIYLNQASNILGIHKISEGATTATTVDIKHLMQGAILSNSTAFAICHNHPSGNTKPSEIDLKLTKQINKAAELFGLKLIDSVIISTNNYYSFNQEGLI